MSLFFSKKDETHDIEIPKRKIRNFTYNEIWLIVEFISLSIILFASVLFITRNSGDKPQMQIDSSAHEKTDVITEVSSYISIPCVSSILFDANQIQQSVKFSNPKQNDCYFVISLILSDGDCIYQSGLIPPGNEITLINLTSQLGRGTYDAVIKYDCYSTEDQHQLNGAVIEVKLEVM